MNINEKQIYESLKELSGKKATGVDNIPAEILKNIGEKTEDILFVIIKECYYNGKIPPDFNKSKTIMLPKKGNSTEYSNYRTIALLSHSSKMLLNIIENMLKTKVEQNLSRRPIWIPERAGN